MTHYATFAIIAYLQGVVYADVPKARRKECVLHAPDQDLFCRIAVDSCHVSVRSDHALGEGNEQLPKACGVDVRYLLSGVLVILTFKVAP